MKRLIFLSVAGGVVLAEILVLVFPSLVLYLPNPMSASPLPTPPKGFDVRREGVERGKLETVDYQSKAAGCARKMRVYTPPRFQRDKNYPVLYLLHGSLADETSWVKDGRADAILDNLYADEKIVPSIVVMPDGNLPAFEQELLGDIIPYMEKHYPVKTGRQHRALAGLSAGAEHALSIALAHPDVFAYVGVFIGGLWDCKGFEKKHQNVLESLGTKGQPKLLWVASGKKDMLYGVCQNTLELLDKYKIRYVYVEGKGIHDWETARNDLFVFVPLVFRDAE